MTEPGRAVAPNIEEGFILARCERTHQRLIYVTYEEIFEPGIVIEAKTGSAGTQLLEDLLIQQPRVSHQA